MEKFTVEAFYERKGQRKSVSRNFPSQSDAENWIKENKKVEVLIGGALQEVPYIEYVITKTVVEVIGLYPNG